MRLNLGCGDHIADGWINADVSSHRPTLEWVRIGNPAEVPLPWPDGTFDGIVANHVLQMVAWPELVPWLAEVRRVLHADGTVRLLVPDLLGAMAAYDRQEWPWFPIDDDHERSIDGKLCMYISQAGATRSVFTPNHLLELCERAGFRGTGVVTHGKTGSFQQWLPELDTREGESLIVEAWA